MKTNWRIVFVLSALALVGGGFWKFVHRARSEAAASTCGGRAYKLRWELYLYYVAQRAYPPLITTTPDGITLSWKSLYGHSEDRQGKPDPEDFLCAGTFTDAQYLLVTGPGTMYPGTTPLTVKEVGDGIENTLLFIEVRPPSARIANVGEFSIDELAAFCNADGTFAYNETHSGGRFLVFADGGCCAQLKPMSASDLKALLTANGGEKITRDQLVRSGVLALRYPGELLNLGEPSPSP